MHSSPGVNVSVATMCGGRFSGVHHWPVLGVHRGPSLAMKNGACRSTSTDGHRRTLTKDYEKLSEQTVEIKRMLTVLVQKLSAEG
jgi:hypothetical protein